MAGRIAYYGNISPQGLVLNLDAAIVGSYPKTGSTWFDISNNGNNGTLISGSLYDSTVFGNVTFNGSASYVQFPVNNFPSGNMDLSFNTWVKWNGDGINNGDFIIGYGNDTGPNKVPLILIDPNKKARFEFGSSAGVVTSSFDIPTGSWMSITATYNKSFTALYVNGTPVGNRPYTTAQIEPNGFNGLNGSLGSLFSTFGNVTSPGTPRRYGTFNGNISVAQIYNRSLSQFDVWQNFNAYKSRYGIPDIVTDGLVLNLDAGNPYSYLSGSSGTTWSNTVAVSSSISGTLTNGPVYSNGTITFDGSNDYVDCGNNTLTNITSPNVTLAAIFSSTNINTTQTIMSKAEGGGYGLELNVTEPSLEVSIHIDGSYRIVTYASSNLQSNSTYYVVGTYDNNQIKLYVNGIQVNALTISGNITSTSVPMCLGTNPATGGGGIRYLTGKIYTAQIYNRALSQTEITQNFNALRGRYGI
jgi:hypothetical protein